MFRKKLIIVFVALFLLSSLHLVDKSNAKNFPRTQIAAGDAHAVYVNDGGNVWAWGRNHFGQLGINSRIDQTKPVFVSIPLTTGDAIHSVAAGKNHTVALTNRGEVWTWGLNNHGQLGRTITEWVSGRERPAQQGITPGRVPGLSNIIAIAAGEYHTLALSRDGKIYSWGYNEYGQLGNDTFTNSTHPVEVKDIHDAIMISANESYSGALRRDGSVWIWGLNVGGELGGKILTYKKPQAVATLRNMGALSMGGFHTLTVDQSNNVWSWGRNNFGQIGDGTNQDRATPIKLSTITNVSQIAAGKTHSLAINKSGDLFSWGFNAFGGLGDGTIENRPAPKKIANVPQMKQVAAGDTFSLGLSHDNVLYAWGYNRYGQLGNGTLEDAVKPHKIDLISVSGVTLAPAYHRMGVGEVKELQATITPRDATEKGLIWESSDTSTVTVDNNGVIRAVRAGNNGEERKATVKVRTVDGGFTAETVVTVYQPVTAISISPTSLQMRTGETRTLQATISPSNSSNKELRWTSSRPGVATVDQSGKVTAVGSGITEITVQAVEGDRKATITVTVEFREVPLEKVTLSPSLLKLFTGEGKAITPVAEPAGAITSNLRWSSNNTTVATVNENGFVRAHREGVAEITATNSNGTIRDTMTVEVTRDEGNIVYFPERRNQPRDKKWTINLSRPVNRNTVNNDHIFIVDTNNNIVPTNLSVSLSGTEITVEPSENYIAGRTYELHIRPDVTGLNGNKLGKTIIKRFHVQ